MAYMWRWYQGLMVRHPWKVQITTAGSLVGVGDIISQQVVEHKGLRNHDGARTAKMMLIGFAFVGPVIGGWYRVLDRLVPGTTKTVALKKMVLDQGAFAPPFLVGFMSIVGTLNGLTYPQILDKLRRNSAVEITETH